MDPIEHHPPHRDGWYEDDDEVRFVVSIRKRPGAPLGPNSPQGSRRSPSDFARIRKAIFACAYPTGMPRRGTRTRPGITYDPATMVDCTTSANPRYLPPTWRDRGPSLNDPKEGPPS